MQEAKPGTAQRGCHNLIHKCMVHHDSLLYACGPQHLKNVGHVLAQLLQALALVQPVDRRGNRVEWAATSVPAKEALPNMPTATAPATCSHGTCIRDRLVMRMGRRIRAS